MAAGKPIVTTDIGSNMEVIENGVSGIIVPRKDVAALAAAIRDLSDRPAYAEQIGKSACAVFEEKYTERKMVDAYMGLYASLVAEHRRRT
jgi:glycosyltransferase involved in cell wall biosynthesis